MARAQRTQELADGTHQFQVELAFFERQRYNGRNQRQGTTPQLTAQLLGVGRHIAIRPEFGAFIAGSFQLVEECRVFERRVPALLFRYSPANRSVCRKDFHDLSP